MQKLWALTWKELYITFTDRSLLLIMLVTPLVLSAIIGFAFGGGTGGTIRLSTIPLAIVNQDAGTQINGQALNYGTQISQILQGQAPEGAGLNLSCAPLEGASAANPVQSQSLNELFRVSLLDSAEQARVGVREGEFSAALIIPADFSQALSINPSASAETQLGQTTLELYASAGAPLSASVTRSVVEGIANTFVKGNIAISATLGALIEQAQRNPAFGIQFLAASASFNPPQFACAFSDAYDGVGVERVPLDEAQTQSAFVQVLISVGSAQALFFAFFTVLYGMLSIYEERKAWTLQRILMSPTPRYYPLLGKVLGTFFSIFLQISLLLLGLTLIASLGEGRWIFIWGDNLLALIVTLFLVVLTMSGIGAFIIGISRTVQQAQLIGPLLNTGFALLGGSFGFQLPQSIAQFSPIYWGVNTFQRLAGGQGDILLNWFILASIGTVLFIVGVSLFNRRVQV